MERGKQLPSFSLPLGFVARPALDSDQSFHQMLSSRTDSRGLTRRTCSNGWHMQTCFPEFTLEALCKTYSQQCEVLVRRVFWRFKWSTCLVCPQGQLRQHNSGARQWQAAVHTRSRHPGGLLSSICVCVCIFDLEYLLHSPARVCVHYLSVYLNMFSSGTFYPRVWLKG